MVELGEVAGSFEGGLSDATAGVVDAAPPLKFGSSFAIPSPQKSTNTAIRMPTNVEIVAIAGSRSQVRICLGTGLILILIQRHRTRSLLRHFPSEALSFARSATPTSLH